MNCQWDMFVQIPELPSSSLISSFQDLRDRFSVLCPCAGLWRLWFLWAFLWIFPCSLYSFRSPSLLDHELKHPSRGLDDPFPLPNERELTAPTSMGSECPREPVSLGLESRILKPNFASTNVTISRRASSKVRKRFELSIRCVSTSSGTVPARKQA